MKYLLIALFFVFSFLVKGQTYPIFGPEIDVTINGLTHDAMEPFISYDGEVLFFNNINDGINTKLYYATKINDSTFNYEGELSGTNQITTPHLDAVADLDSMGNFFWTSTRDYPAELNNLFHGIYNSGTVSNIGRVYGDFNKNIPGWLVMDHGISYNGQFLYYNNARFNDSCTGPCETELGIAQKVNDSTFNKIPESDLFLQEIINADYNYYAPFITSDNLELYYTRYLKDTITISTVFDICVAVRESDNQAFSVPEVLFSETIANLIEAPTLTGDKQIIYYHKKTADSHKIVMRYREDISRVGNIQYKEHLTLFPNPASHQIIIDLENIIVSGVAEIIDVSGKIIQVKVQNNKIDISKIPPGSYGLIIRVNGMDRVGKFTKLK